MDVHEAIQTKRAIREFNNQPLDKKTVITIINAGRRAQSAKNMQPWHFIAIENKDTLKSLSQLGSWASHLASAALAVAIITPSPEMRFSIMFDAGQAAAYMQLAAWELGIGSCLATIYQTEEARQLLGFPGDLHVRIAISFGYPKDSQLIIAHPKRGGRKGIQEIVHWETW
jgi:nitroreductase